MSEQMKREAESRATDTAEKLERDLSAMRQLADTDPLTGMPNRRSFMASAAAAMDYFRRYARPIGFLMVDIDSFKQINDRFGHVAGDAVICAVGQHIQSAIRASDKAARFGGVEFVVLLREAEDTAVRQLAERIRTSVEANPVSCADASISLTVSVGCAIAVQADRDVEAVMERADAALYTAKNAGRNRVVFVTTLDRPAEKRVA
jgi:diguanylate cyclase (GGDEF)-like protein